MNKKLTGYVINTAVKTRKEMCAITNCGHYSVLKNASVSIHKIAFAKTLVFQCEQGQSLMKLI